MNQIDFVSIDFETANRKRWSACSIGLARVRAGVVVDKFYLLLRPEPLEFEFINVATHGITPEMVRDSPTFLEAWSEIEGFIGSDVLVAHNASFEQSVINQSFNQAGHRLPDLEYLCTLYMSRVNYPNRGGYRLPDVFKDIFGRPVNHHDALEDAVACAELGVHLIQMFREQSPRELVKVLYDIPMSRKRDWEKLTGIKPTREELDPNHAFFDKRIAITGELSSMSREQAVRVMVNCGAIYSDGVTMACNYLVVGDQEHQIMMYGSLSNKLIKARRYNEKGSQIQIINEQQFLEIAKELVD